ARPAPAGPAGRRRFPRGRRCHRGREARSGGEGSPPSESRSISSFRKSYPVSASSLSRSNGHKKHKKAQQRKKRSNRSLARPLRRRGSGHSLLCFPFCVFLCFLWLFLLLGFL